VAKRIRRNSPAPPAINATVTYSFDIKNPLAATAARNHGAALVVELTKETRRALARVIHEAVRTGIQRRELSQMIRPMIGLTSRQAMGVMRARAAWEAAGLRGPKLRAAVSKLAAKKLAARAKLIARTESIRAASEGQLSAWRGAADAGLLDPSRTDRVWSAAPDERTCPVCNGLAGEVVGFDEAFSIGVMTPPAHPACRCSVSLKIRRARAGSTRRPAAPASTPAPDRPLPNLRRAARRQP
jgi:SPP1 gp7 family putative phage head morphogenesis protein